MNLKKFVGVSAVIATLIASMVMPAHAVTSSLSAPAEFEVIPRLQTFQLMFTNPGVKPDSMEYTSDGGATWRSFYVNPYQTAHDVWEQSGEGAGDFDYGVTYELAIRGVKSEWDEGLQQNVRTPGPVSEIISATLGKVAVTPTFSKPVITKNSVTFYLTNYDPKWTYYLEDWDDNVIASKPVGKKWKFTFRNLLPGEFVELEVQVRAPGYAMAWASVEAIATPPKISFVNMKSFAGGFQAQVKTDMRGKWQYWLGLRVENSTTNISISKTGLIRVTNMQHGFEELDVSVTPVGLNMREQTWSKVTAWALPELNALGANKNVEVGEKIRITGKSLRGVTKITVGGVNVTNFVVNTSRSVTLTIPAGAKSGDLAVTTPGGTAKTPITVN